jgi:hypothetical protein
MFLKLRPIPNYPKSAIADGSREYSRAAKPGQVECVPKNGRKYIAINSLRAATALLAAS